MRISSFYTAGCLFMLFCSCGGTFSPDHPVHQVIPDSSLDIKEKPIESLIFDSGKLSPGVLVDFAETLIGTPYKYGSVDPVEGFDCSGFISYVFNHFQINVPRSSVDFTHVGKEVNVSEARRGDLVLFTGTDSSSRVVGHMGIVTGNSDSLRFIHSTSGKKYGVTITALNEHYQKRFVKVIRVFE